MMGDKRVCPFRMNSNYMFKECIGKSCRWWREYAKDCAIPLLADMFAESETCRTEFTPYDGKF